MPFARTPSPPFQLYHHAMQILYPVKSLNIILLGNQAFVKFAHSGGDGWRKLWDTWNSEAVALDSAANCGMVKRSHLNGHDRGTSETERLHITVFREDLHSPRPQASTSHFEAILSRVIRSRVQYSQAVTRSTIRLLLQWAFGIRPLVVPAPLLSQTLSRDRYAYTARHLSRLSPIPRVTRAQAKTFNGETELALPAGVKRIRKPTEKVTAYDPTADFTPSPPRKKRARPGKSAAEQSSPGKNARIKATAPAAKRPVKKAPHTKTAPPAQKASRSNQPGGDNTVPSVNPTGPPAPTAKAAINAPAMQRVHPSPAARVDSVDHRVDTNTADRTATNFFEHFPFGPVAPITPSRVIVDGLISASQKNQHPSLPSPLLAPHQHPHSSASPTGIHQPQQLGPSLRPTQAGFRVSKDGLYQTRRHPEVGSQPHTPPAHGRLSPSGSFTPRQRTIPPSRIPAPRFGPQSPTAQPDLTGPVTPPSPEHVESHDYGDWNGCTGISPTSLILSERPHPSSSRSRPSPSIRSLTPVFNIRGHHVPAPSDTQQELSGSGDDTSHSDYGRDQEEERHRRARSQERRRDNQRKQDDEEADTLHHVQNWRARQREEEQERERKVTKSREKGHDKNLPDVRDGASTSRLTVPPKQTATLIANAEPAAILTGFDAPQADEDVDDDDDHDDDHVAKTGKGKGKAGPLGSKRGRMSADTVSRCQAFGAEVHRSGMVLAEELQVNLVTLMRTAGLTIKAAKVGNFANSLRMVISHEHADRVAAGEALADLTQSGLEALIVQWKLDNSDDDDARQKVEETAKQLRAQCAEEVSPAQLRQQTHVVAKQLTALATAYHQTQNFFILGVVMHLGDEFATSTFASDRALYDQLVSGFDLQNPATQRKTLDKMKTMLKYITLNPMPSAHPAGRYDLPADKSRWRDWYYTSVTRFLISELCKFVTVSRFPYHNWQTVAADHKLVLVGSDRRLLSQPGVKWMYKVAGGNQLAHLATLLSRIAEPDNTFYNLPEGALSLQIMHLNVFYAKFPKLRGPRAPAVVDHEATVLVWAAFKDEDQAALCEHYQVIPLADAQSGKSKAASKSRRLPSKTPAAHSQHHVTVDVISDAEDMTLVAPRGTAEPWSPSDVPSPPRQMATKRARFNSPPPPSYIHHSPAVVGRKRKAEGNDHYTNVAAESPYRPQKPLPTRPITHPAPTRDSQRNPVQRVVSRESAPILPPNRSHDIHQYQPHPQHPRPYNDQSGYYRAPTHFVEPQHYQHADDQHPRQLIPRNQAHEDHLQYQHPEDPYHGDRQPRYR
ncbi:hypothetical protein FIBSPDRAFT_900198 [Athelia psychrophila]|uniref:Uncharacterized protein n=1 Tax=Athelia psychrophila TaxID=1759441 RepID=A0A165YSI2_9AGAM|nr:hypothetical protein FIBSPDRAFT_900198 [Fibularhizoctonia sp. CBS 109695]